MGWRDRIAQLTGRRPPAVQGCRRPLGDICIVVSRKDDPNQGVPGVQIALEGPTPGRASTDANGIAEFLQRQPGRYTYKVTLPSDQRKRWRLTSDGGDVSVGAGGIASEFVEIFPIGTLVVRVFDDASPRRRVKAQTASSVAWLDDGEPTYHGEADLQMTVAAGSCTVSANALDADMFGNAAAQKQVDVPQGGVGIAEFVLPLVNLVLPHLEPARDEVWFLRDDPAPAAAVVAPLPPGSVAVVAPPPAPPTVRSTHDEPAVAVKLGIVESLPAKPYLGTATLAFDATRLRLHRDPACATPPLASGMAITNAELKSGLTLYMKGAEAGAVSIDLSLAASADAAVVLTRALVSKPVAVKEINVVEPVIDVEYRVVLFDHKLSRYQQRAEPEKFDPPPTFVDLSVKQRIDAPAYRGDATLLAAPACVEMFTDADCRKRFNAGKPIGIDKLLGAAPLRLYLKPKDAKTFELKLTLAASGDPHVIVEHPAKVPMGVAKLRMELHQQDEKAIAKLSVDPDAATYHADLEALVLPPQEPIDQKEAIKEGRLLHMQDGSESFSRARLVVKQLDAAQWPAGVDNYKLVLTASDGDGTIRLFDKDAKANPAGVELPLPATLNVADLLQAEKELWVEGATTSSDWRSIRLDLGLDRVEPSSAHHVPIGDKTVKRHGDWARFTVVRIDDLRVIYKPSAGKAVAWDAPANRFHINVKKDPGGRAMKIGATLVPPLKGVKLHLMLAPHENNRKAANWGVDMPAAWSWETLSEKVKHKDRKKRSAFLSYDVTTDKDGKVEKTVVLSRFGGDRFWPAAHLAQDPQLARFVDGHATLGLRKPVMRTASVEVYRRFWVRKIAVAGIPAQAFAGATGQYGAVKADMVTVPELTLSAATVRAYKPTAIYPRYMIEVGGGAADALVVSDTNKGNFFKTFKSDADKPNTVPILVCDAQWDPGGVTAPTDVPGQLDNAFPLVFDVGEKVLSPPLKGKKLVVSGTCVAHDWDPVAGAWINERSVKVRDADVTIDPARADLEHVQLNIPAAITVVPGLTSIRFDGLSLAFANSYLGESFQKRILAVFDPTDPGDFQNTIAHELGHSFAQVVRGDGGVAGLPPHPNQVDAGQGNHCNHNVNECVMFASSQPVAARLNNYCVVCRPYMLVQNMSVTQ